MKSKEKIFKFIKTHKVVSVACSGALVLGIGLGSFGIANAVNLQNARNAVLSQMAENGDLSADDVQKLADSGQLGQEIVDPNTGETVVLTQNEDGTVTKTVVADANGNSTGATVPTNNNSGGNSGGGSSSGGSSDTPAVHTHSWTPHYATGTRTVTTPVYHPAVTQQVLVHGAGNMCNACGYVGTCVADYDNHTDATGHGGWHSCSAEYKTVTVQEAYTENVSTQEQYQYVDYYYCSECGARQ